MTKQNKNVSAFSSSLLLLDFIGVVMVVVGFAEYTHVFHIMPESLQFPNFPIVMIAVGLLCMLPFAWDIIKQTRLPK